MVQKLSVLVLLAVCSMEDLKTKRIHTVWLKVFAAEGLAGTILLWQRPVYELILAMTPGMFFLLLAFAAHGGIGEGDGLVLIIMGFFLKPSLILGMLVLAVFLSAGYALFLFIAQKKNRKYEIPFIPFLLAAYVGEIAAVKYF